MYQLPGHKKKRQKKKDSVFECSCQMLWNREIISKPNFKLDGTIFDFFFISLRGTVVYTACGWLGYAQVV